MMTTFDLARHWQWNFQDPASPLMEGLIDLHHNILFILIIIFGMVTSLMVAILKDTSFIWIKPTSERILRRKQYLLFSNINHGTLLEIVWTLIPSFILFGIAIPSFTLLYSMEELLDPQITVKVVATQWFWTYEYGNLGLHWDSYMRFLSDMKPGQPRLLSVDHPLFLPVETNIRLLIASNDVIHAFAVPSLGLKVDAVPGRLNQLSCYINRPGIFYGQCSELCGTNHAFMPIETVAILMVFPYTMPIDKAKASLIQCEKNIESLKESILTCNSSLNSIMLTQLMFNRWILIDIIASDYNQYVKHFRLCEKYMDALIEGNWVN